MARNTREFEDLLKLPADERLRLANWLIDSAVTENKPGASDSERTTVEIPITVDLSAEFADQNSARAWAVLRSMTGTLEGPADWSQELDHYLYGTSKRAESNE